MTPPLPEKKFDIIYPDPPWPYDLIGKNFSKQFTKKKDGFAPVVSSQDHYDDMTIEDIAAIDVKSICNPDCLCYMWATGPLLDKAIFVLEAWGFTYKTIAFVWDKRAVNPGFYTMSQVEICIVGKRGKIPQPRGIRNCRQFYSERRTKHSKKPDEFRNRITLMHPEQSKLEMFARTTAPGWDSWGLEVGKFDKEKVK